MPTILIVDDSAVDQRIAGACVEQLGCQARYAANGVEALDELNREPPDIVLTDLHMPELDGLQLVRAIRESYSAIPVVLMTAFGNEETAVEALRAGAASYVPKRFLRRDLGDAVRSLLSVIQARQQRELVRQFLEVSTSKFVIGNQARAVEALISYLQDGLLRLNFCDESTLMQIATALTEAVNNAVQHGNLELDSRLRESEDGAYEQQRRERATQPPYCDRRVRVTVSLTPDVATFTVQDDGAGFDPNSLPDPTNPENMLCASGRGVMLMHAFMDEVIFNERGNEVTLVKRRNGT